MRPKLLEGGLLIIGDFSDMVDGISHERISMTSKQEDKKFVACEFGELLFFLGVVGLVCGSGGRQDLVPHGFDIKIIIGGKVPKIFEFPSKTTIPPFVTYFRTTTFKAYPNLSTS